MRKVIDPKPTWCKVSAAIPPPLQSSSITAPRTPRPTRRAPQGIDGSVDAVSPRRSELSMVGHEILMNHLIRLPTCAHHHRFPCSVAKGPYRVAQVEVDPKDAATTTYPGMPGDLSIAEHFLPHLLVDALVPLRFAWDPSSCQASASGSPPASICSQGIEENGGLASRDRSSEETGRARGCVLFGPAGSRRQTYGPGQLTARASRSSRASKGFQTHFCWSTADRDVALITVEVNAAVTRGSSPTVSDFRLLSRRGMSDVNTSPTLEP